MRTFDWDREFASQLMYTTSMIEMSMGNQDFP